MNYRKHIVNCTFLLVLLSSLSPFWIHLETKAEATNQLPEAEIEQIIDDCLSDKFPRKAFYTFILEVIQKINHYKTYFIQKYTIELVNSLLIDLPKLEHARKPIDVQRILEKYKHYPWLFGKKKRNPTHVLLALARRLKIPRH